MRFTCAGRWPDLVRVLGDPKIPLDTNGVECALRGAAVAPKNHQEPANIGLEGVVCRASPKGSFLITI
jgi:hypothetical protein